MDAAFAAAGDPLIAGREAYAELYRHDINRRSAQVNVLRTMRTLLNHFSVTYFPAYMRKLSLRKIQQQR
jgi:hypothetical protein